MSNGRVKQNFGSLVKSASSLVLSVEEFILSSFV